MDERQSCFAMRSDKAKPKREGKQGMLSAVQVKDGLRKGEITYLAALIEIKVDQKIKVPDLVVKMLTELLMSYLQNFLRLFHLDRRLIIKLNWSQG